MCAEVGGDYHLSFSDFCGRLGQTIKIAVLRWLRSGDLERLSGDLEMLKDIFESDNCSISIQRPGVEESS